MKTAETLARCRIVELAMEMQILAEELKSAARQICAIAETGNVPRARR